MSVTTTSISFKGVEQDRVVAALASPASSRRNRRIRPGTRLRIEVVMRSRFVYPVAAFAMGGFWFIVLFPFVGQAEGFGTRDLPVNLIAMCLAGLTVAMLFRRPIVAAEGAAFHLLAITLPGVSAFVFGGFVVLFQWLGLVFRPGSRLSPGILLVPIYCVVFGHLALFFVTLPMGYFSQWAMRRVGSAAVVDSAGGGPLSSRSAGDGPSNRGGA